MACKDKTATIGTKKHYCRQWPVSKALVMQSRLLTNLEDFAFKFADGTYTKAHIAGMLKDAPEDLMPMIKEFVCEARVDGKVIETCEFDIEYAGDLNRVFDVFAFVVQVNFQDFFASGRK